MRLTLLLPLIAVLSTGCAALGPSQPSPEPRTINPEIAKLVQEKRENPPQTYPKLADVPSSPPEQISPVQREMIANELVSDGTSLEREISQDITTIAYDRRFDLLSLAATIRKAIENDAKIAHRLQRRPAPRLGGTPPDPDRMRPKQEDEDESATPSVAAATP